MSNKSEREQILEYIFLLKIRTDQLKKHREALNYCRETVVAGILYNNIETYKDERVALKAETLSIQKIIDDMEEIMGERYE